MSVDQKDIQELNCTFEVTMIRIKFCAACENNVIEVFPKCTQCDCPISSLTSMSFKTCPIGKW